MHCPFCKNHGTRVLDTRISEDGFSIRRRRTCPVCNKRFTTVESILLLVKKKDGKTEPFDRTKVMHGVRKACQGRPVEDSDLRILADRVEEALRSKGTSEVRSIDVGMAILEPLKRLDAVAYLRFASVYEKFSGAEDFEKAIAELRRIQNEEEKEMQMGQSMLSQTSELSQESESSHETESSHPVELS